MSPFTAPKQQLLCIGKLKPKQSQWIQTGWQEYAKRLNPYFQLELIEIPAGSAKSGATDSAAVKKAEAERLTPYWEKAGTRIVLSEHGKTYLSERFAETFRNVCLTGNPANRGSGERSNGAMLWVIGGAHGLAPHLVQQADWVVSLSPLTFPHQWVRLLWIEQLYRACRLLSGEPYHK